MDDRGIELLYQYACEYRFEEFDGLFSQLSPSLAPAELKDALLMRAQIKLLSTDKTFSDDLEAAGSIGAHAGLPCLGLSWTPDGPNRFVAFPKAPGALRAFMDLLPAAAQSLDRLYGKAGRGMALQVQSEALYFMGEVEQALDIAQAMLDEGPASDSGALLALYVMFRCCLATGAAEKAGRCMLKMIQLAKSSAECAQPYIVVRDWANLTTGWCGDTPRFSGDSDEAQPVFDDRLDAIHDGISQLSPCEQSFAGYAARKYDGAYTMRQYYMDIFNAMYWFQAGDEQAAQSYFATAYDVAVASGLITPFAEYGKQIIPFLQRMRSGGADCDCAWGDRVLAFAERYERGLDAYRA